MQDQNFTLKNPIKYYIWSVVSFGNFRQIFTTSNLSPKNFHFEVGQFIGTPIKEMKLIGYRFVKDHYGRDIEETFENTGKFMKQEIIDNYNSSDVVKRS